MNLKFSELFGLFLMFPLPTGLYYIQDALTTKHKLSVLSYLQ